MLRAFAVKGVALAAAVLAAWLLPPGWATLVVVAVVLAMVGFLTYAIMHPRSQFFAPVVDRLPAADAVALTFDDGPDPVVTPQILDVLCAHGARATFFVLGERAARYPDVIRRIQREGHAIGTHTQHHRIRFHFSGPRGVQREIDAAIAVVDGILGTRPALFRPPQGLRTPLFGSAWRRMHGLVCVTWTARGLDSFSTTAAAITTRIVPRLVPGAIIALHDGTGLGGGSDRRPTVAALATILAACHARGLSCVALDAATLAAPARSRLGSAVPGAA